MANGWTSERRERQRRSICEISDPDVAVEQHKTGAVQHRDGYMLLGTLIPEGDGWIYELNLDG